MKHTVLIIGSIYTLLTSSLCKVQHDIYKCGTRTTYISNMADLFMHTFIYIQCSIKNKLSLKFTNAICTMYVSHIKITIVEVITLPFGLDEALI